MCAHRVRKVRLPKRFQRILRIQLGLGSGVVLAPENLCFAPVSIVTALAWPKPSLVLACAEQEGLHAVCRMHGNFPTDTMCLPAPLPFVAVQNNSSRRA